MFTTIECPICFIDIKESEISCTICCGKKICTECISDKLINVCPFCRNKEFYSNGIGLIRDSLIYNQVELTIENITPFNTEIRNTKKKIAVAIIGIIIVTSTAFGIIYSL